MHLNTINPEISVGTEVQHIRVAILDLYNNEPNEGMRCILHLLNEYPAKLNQSISFKIYDVRFRHEVPTLDYDIYISTGGPGSPLEEPGARWEKKYFEWLELLLAFNKEHESNKKHAFFICHSFQLLCRYLGVAEVCRRSSTAFGIFPVHLTEDGKTDFLLNKLPDPFYAVDSRDWQIIQPDLKKLAKMGARIMAIEKERPHVNFERAVMAIRFSEEIFGTQFHPEADALGMLHYLTRTDKKDHVVKHHGLEKYDQMLLHLNDVDKLNQTQSKVLPAFLFHALAVLENNLNKPVSNGKKVNIRI